MLRRWTSRLMALLIFTSLAISAPTYAATIQKAKGKKVLVNTDGDSLEVGQIYTVRDANDKAVGLIKITKVGRGKAVAVLGKGTAKSGQTIKLRAKQTKTAKKSSGSDSSAESSEKTTDTYWGFMAGFSMASADVDLFDAGGNPAGSVSLDGNGFSAKGLYDFPLFSSINFRGLLGIEQFNVSGATNASCTGSGKCETEIMYLTFDFWGRLMLSQGTTRPWVGLGGALLFPLSKSSTALKENSITNTNIFAFGGGLDFFLSPKTYIPVQVEYNMYPKSDTVKASSIVIRGGFATEF
jgi:hypothetical protein